MLRSRRVWLGAVVTLVFLGLLFFRTDLSAIAAAFRAANYWWVFPAVLVYGASVWVRAVRYRFIVRSVQDIPARALFPVLVIGYMANNLLPARAGELIRAYVLGTRFAVSKMAALGTVAVERLFDGLTLLGFLSITVLLLGGDGLLMDLMLVSVAIFAAALAFFIVALAAPDTTERIVDLCVRVLPGRLRERARGLAWSFVEGLRALRHPDAFAWVAGTSVLAWLLEAVVFWLVGLAFGLEVAFGYYVMAVGAANLAITAPSSQGGIGPFEYFTKLVLVSAGISESVGAAYGFAVHAVVILPATVLGLYYLWAMNLSLGNLRRSATEPPAPVPVAADD